MFLCSFVDCHGRSGPAKPWDKYNVDWVPTLNLGHAKRKAEGTGKAVQERAERAKVRGRRSLTKRNGLYYFAKRNETKRNRVR